MVGEPAFTLADEEDSVTGVFDNVAAIAKNRGSARGKRLGEEDTERIFTAVTQLLPGEALILEKGERPGPDSKEMDSTFRERASWMKRSCSPPVTERKSTEVLPSRELSGRIVVLMWYRRAAKGTCGEEYPGEE